MNLFFDKTTEAMVMFFIVFSGFLIVSLIGGLIIIITVGPFAVLGWCLIEAAKILGG